MQPQTATTCKAACGRSVPGGTLLAGGWQRPDALPRPRLALQDESNPDFVAEVVELYFEDSATKIDTLDTKLREPAPNFAQVWGGCWLKWWRGRAHVTDCSARPDMLH